MLEICCRLTLLGKIAVLKSLVASHLVFIFSPLQTNREASKKSTQFSISFYGMIKETKSNER